MALDLEFVRSQFPALAGEWVFMDNAGGSQVLRTVAERVSDYLLTSNVQTGASYAPSLDSTARVREALNNAIQATLTGSKTAKEALTEAQATAERLLRPYQ